MLDDVLDEGRWLPAPAGRPPRPVSKDFRRLGVIFETPPPQEWRLAIRMRNALVHDDVEELDSINHLGAKPLLPTFEEWLRVFKQLVDSMNKDVTLTIGGMIGAEDPWVSTRS